MSLNDSTETTVSTKVADIRKRLNDPTQALVPVKGGHGGYGAGLEVMKARNAGEAKWAKKMGRNFTDSKMRELHKTRVAFVHNSQKHFRDPLREFRCLVTTSTDVSSAVDVLLSCVFFLF